MADKKPDSAKAVEAPAEPPKKKKGLPIKTIAIVLVVMVVEAAAVVFVLGMGGPKDAHAGTHEETLVDDDSEETQEIELVSDKYQNLQTGRVWIWDLSVFVQVKNKNADVVKAVLEQRQAEIKEGVGQIISRAQHTQLKEAERQTLVRQITAHLEKVKGLSVDNHPLIERVMIPKCRGYPSDF